MVKKTIIVKKKIKKETKVTKKYCVILKKKKRKQKGGSNFNINFAKELEEQNVNKIIENKRFETEQEMFLDNNNAKKGLETIIASNGQEYEVWYTSEDNIKNPNKKNNAILVKNWAKIFFKQAIKEIGKEISNKNIETDEKTIKKQYNDYSLIMEAIIGEAKNQNAASKPQSNIQNPQQLKTKPPEKPSQTKTTTANKDATVLQTTQPPEKSPQILLELKKKITENGLERTYKTKTYNLNLKSATNSVSDMKQKLHAINDIKKRLLGKLGDDMSKIFRTATYQRPDNNNPSDYQKFIDSAWNLRGSKEAGIVTNKHKIVNEIIILFLILEKMEITTESLVNLKNDLTISDTELQTHFGKMIDNMINKLPSTGNDAKQTKTETETTSTAKPPQTSSQTTPPLSSKNGFTEGNDIHNFSILKKKQANFSSLMRKIEKKIKKNRNALDYFKIEKNGQEDAILNLQEINDIYYVTQNKSSKSAELLGETDPVNSRFKSADLLGETDPVFEILGYQKEAGDDKQINTTGSYNLAIRLGDKIDAMHKIFKKIHDNLNDKNKLHELKNNLEDDYYKSRELKLFLREFINKLFKKKELNNKEVVKLVNDYFLLSEKTAQELEIISTEKEKNAYKNFSRITMIDNYLDNIYSNSKELDVGVTMKKIGTIANLDEKLLEYVDKDGKKLREVDEMYLLSYLIKKILGNMDDKNKNKTYFEDLAKIKEYLDNSKPKINIPPHLKGKMGQDNYITAPIGKTFDNYIIKAKKIEGNENIGIIAKNVIKSLNLTQPSSDKVNAMLINKLIKKWLESDKFIKIIADLDLSYEFFKKILVPKIKSTRHTDDPDSTKTDNFIEKIINIVPGNEKNKTDFKNEIMKIMWNITFHDGNFQTVLTNNVNGYEFLNDKTKTNRDLYFRVADKVFKGGFVKFLTNEISVFIDKIIESFDKQPFEHQDHIMNIGHLLFGMLYWFNRDKKIDDNLFVDTLNKNIDKLNSKLKNRQEKLKSYEGPSVRNERPIFPPPLIDFIFPIKGYKKNYTKKEDDNKKKKSKQKKSKEELLEDLNTSYFFDSPTELEEWIVDNKIVSLNDKQLNKKISEVRLAIAMYPHARKKYSLATIFIDYENQNNELNNKFNNLLENMCRIVKIDGSIERKFIDFLEYFKEQKNTDFNTKSCLYKLKLFKSEIKQSQKPNPPSKNNNNNNQKSNNNNNNNQNAQLNAIMDNAAAQLKNKKKSNNNNNNPPSKNNNNNPPQQPNPPKDKVALLNDLNDEWFFKNEFELNKWILDNNIDSLNDLEINKKISEVRVPLVVGDSASFTADATEVLPRSAEDDKLRRILTKIPYPWWKDSTPDQIKNKITDLNTKLDVQQISEEGKEVIKKTNEALTKLIKVKKEALDFQTGTESQLKTNTSVAVAVEKKGGKKTKKILKKIVGKKIVRKHRGIIQIGGNRGRLRKGYKYSGKRLKSGIPEILKVKSKK